MARTGLNHSGLNPKVESATTEGELTTTPSFLAPLLYPGACEEGTQTLWWIKTTLTPQTRCCCYHQRRQTERRRRDALLCPPLPRESCLMTEPCSAFREGTTLPLPTTAFGASLPSDFDRVRLLLPSCSLPARNEALAFTHRTPHAR